MFKLSMSKILYSSHISCLNVSCALFHCKSENWSHACILIERSRRQFVSLGSLSKDLGGNWLSLRSIRTYPGISYDSAIIGL
jgi:hypothetical protein